MVSSFKPAILPTHLHKLCILLLGLALIAVSPSALAQASSTAPLSQQSFQNEAEETPEERAERIKKAAEERRK